jgi:excisionase family DNA binding protein
MRSDERRLLTSGQVAGRLAVSKQTVYRLVATDDLPAIRLGGAGRSLRVDEADLEEWLRDRHTQRKERDQ